MVQIKPKATFQPASLPYFRLILLPVAALLALLVPVGQLIVGGVLVLVVPGFLVWRALGHDMYLPRLAVFGMWIALSLSIVPLVFLWTSTIGIPLMPVVLQVVFTLLGLVALWIGLVRSPFPNPPSLAPAWLWASFAVLFGLAALTRALHIRDIAAPLWVDSIHHTLLVRVVGETGHIPTSLEPYLPIRELPYHWGYHVVAAAWRAVSGLPLVEGVLWSGQVLNALIMPAVYTLGASLLRSPRAGLLAGGCAALLSIMPAYYVTWGRYTQLTGLLVLPVLLVVTAALLERPRLEWRLLLVAALLVAGLFLIHYRVLIFYAAFMLPYTLLLVGRRPRQAGAIVIRGTLLGGITLLLVAPWAWVLVQRMVVPLASRPSGLVGTDSYNGFDRNLLLAGHNRVLIAIAGIGAALAWVWWRWRVLALVGWVATMLLIANPSVVGLPSLWLINNHAVIITLFLPISLLVAHAINSILVLIERVGIQRSSFVVHRSLTIWRCLLFIVHSGALGALFIVFAWAAWTMRSVINTQTIIATPADIAAVRWVAANTPPDARFLTNSTPWIGSAARGTDGGYWLLPLAGRTMTTPTALYIYGDPADKQHADDVNRRVAALGGNRAMLHELVRRERIDYVFVGSNGGAITPDMLRNDPLFVPVYDQDGVLIVAAQAVP